MEAHETKEHVVDTMSSQSSPKQIPLIDANQETDEKDDAPDEYPHGPRLAALIVSLLLSMFLVALDNVSLLK